MRAFIISLILLGLCLGICVLNDTATHRIINTALNELDSLTPRDIKRFNQSWQRNSYLFFFTVKQSFLREIDDALQRLTAATEHDDEYEFDAAKSALIYKMKELCRSQSFNIKSIL